MRIGVLQVNFDAERFVDYITRADAFQQSIKTKLAQAGVKARPSAAVLPWFDLQGSPLDFDLKKALRGQPVNADTLEALGQEVGTRLPLYLRLSVRVVGPCLINAGAQLLWLSDVWRGGQRAHTGLDVDSRAMCACCCLQVSLLHRREVMRKEHRVLLGLHELLTYGLKGVAAYAHHAEMLGKVDPELDNMFEEVSCCVGCPASYACVLHAIKAADCAVHSLMLVQTLGCGIC